MNDEMKQEDFEQFLKSQTDKHRMYPSDQIWRNINVQLHGNSRWPALTFAAILTGTLLTAGLIFLHPDKDLFKVSTDNSASQNLTAKNISASKPVADQPSATNVSILKPVNQNAVIYSFNKQDDGSLDEAMPAAGSGLTAIAETISLSEPVLPNPNSSTSLLNNKSNLLKDAAIITPVLQSVTDESLANTEGNDLIITDNLASANTVSDAAPVSNEDLLMADQASDEKNIAPIPALLKEKKKGPRFSVQIYGGSSISYRRLSEPASYDYHFPFNAALTADPRRNVNNLVSQKPAVGFEFGSSLSYSLNDKIRIKAGLQFNFRQYNINAFKAPFEPAVLLMNNNASTDSVIVFSSIRNGDGFKPLTLQNRYYQVGLPVGIDWTFAEGRKVNFSLGATLQPTYQLNANMYMLTSDYKSYVQQPDMVRRWNFNAGAEALANFNAGGLKWQIGPQVRYQMLPTQIKSYSVHEHLIDYGLKLGIIKQIK